MRCGDINDPEFINYREAVSWLIGARLLEYGKNFKIGTDPGGGVGMYNLLVIRDAKTHRQRVHLNRNGYIHIFGSGGDTRLWWPDDPACADDVADAIAAKCDWTERQAAPRPAIAIARLIGKALLQQGPGWVCHPASVNDVTSRTSDFAGTLFERYRGAQERLQVPSPLGGEASERFFFLVRQSADGVRPQPWFAFDMAGYAWQVDQEEPITQPIDWPDAMERILSELMRS